MRHKWMGHAGRWLAMLLLTVMGALLLAAPARAAASTPRTAADTITLSIDNGTATFVYGQTPVPTFTAVVTFGTKPTVGHNWQISVLLDGGNQIGFQGNTPTPSQDGMTETFTRIMPQSPIPAGNHAVTASFQNPDTNATAYSNSVNITINKAPTTLSCRIDGAPRHFVGVGQTLQVRMNPDSQPGYEDWQNGTVTVTFEGPTHITRPNLVPDSNGVVTTPGPTQNGKYILSCAFSGTSLWTSATYTDTLAYTFSAMQSPSSVQLFTNPTTLAAQRNLDFYVVFHAAPGSPTPTGVIQIWMGQYYTDSINLSSNGDCLVHLYPLATLRDVTQITIRYWGDIYYNEASFNFPLTNPPIPGSAGSGGGSNGGGSSGGFSGGAQGNATATASTMGTPGATQTVDATPTVVGPGDMTPLATPPTGNSGIFWLIGGFILLVLAGLGTTAGVVLFRARRAKSAKDAGSDAAKDFADRSPVPFQ